MYGALPGVDDVDAGSAPTGLAEGPAQCPASALGPVDADHDPAALGTSRRPAGVGWTLRWFG
jgi:hypothetical protein